MKYNDFYEVLPKSIYDAINLGFRNANTMATKKADKKIVPPFIDTIKADTFHQYIKNSSNTSFNNKDYDKLKTNNNGVYNDNKPGKDDINKIKDNENIKKDDYFKNNQYNNGIKHSKNSDKFETNHNLNYDNNNIDNNQDIKHNSLLHNKEDSICVLMEEIYSTLFTIRENIRILLTNTKISNLQTTLLSLLDMTNDTIKDMGLDFFESIKKVKYLKNVSFFNYIDNEWLLQTNILNFIYNYPNHEKGQKLLKNYILRIPLLKRL